MTAVQLLQDFFGSVRKLTMDGLKLMSSAERHELAQEIANQRGLVAKTDPVKNSTIYVPA